MRVPVSKLHRPRLSRSVIDRTWLFDRPAEPGPWQTDDVDPETDAAPVTVVSAPAGTGKTTLLSSWAKDRAEAGAAVAWVSLDSDDNDRVMFWSGLLAAVRDATVVQPETSGGSPVDDVTVDERFSGAPLLQLEAMVADSPSPVWLFLDDFQEVSSPDVLGDVDALLRRLPDGLLLVLATRRDPAVALHRLRLSGRLRDIRAVDLALDRSEVRQLLVHHGVVLAEADLSLLVDRTEGWAAGVRLAALTLSDVDDPQSAVQHFAGDDRTVADYLAAEIIGRLSDRERHLLRLCAVPDQLTPELAIAVTGEPLAVELLETLYRDNALVVRMNRPDGWYRMHSLLRGYLLTELRRAEPSLVADAHRRTALWFAAQGHPDRSITHAVQAGDDALAVDMITAHGPTMLADGRARALHRLVRTSSDAVRDEPTVHRLDTLAALEVDGTPVVAVPRPRQPMPDEVRERVVAAEARRGPLQALISLEQARQDLGLSGAVLEATASPRDDHDGDLGLLLALSRGLVLLLAGRMAEAGTELAEADALARASGTDHALIRASAYRAALASSQSNFTRAWDLAAETLETAARAGAMSTPEAAGTLLLAAHSARQRLDHSGALALTDRVRVLLEGGTSADVEVRMSLASLSTILEVEAGADPLTGARRMRECWSIAAGQPVSPHTATYLCFLEHRCAWLAGRLDWAHEALARLTALGPGGEAEVLAATEHLARGRHDAARHRLAPVLAGSIVCLQPVNLQHAWLLEAVLADHGQQPARCHEALTEALRMAEELGALRAFLDVPRVPQLLDEHAARFGRLDPVVARIRAAAAVRPDQPFVPMTPKELALLSDLPAPLTLEEIADRHQVSVNTVKTHVRSIYQKLDASSRRDAIASARRRGLL